MPKRTATKGFPRNPKDCFASRHQSASEFKVYDAIVACAHHWRTVKEGNNATGPLIFNASVVPWLCNAVALSKNPTRQAVKNLLHQGWLVLLKEGRHRRDGSQEPNEYRVVEHEEFVRLHPGSCPPDIYAPDYETAHAHGVGYGDPATSDGALPKNFWANSGPLGQALEKLTGDEVAIITDEEQTAWARHEQKFAAGVSSTVPAEASSMVGDRYPETDGPGTAKQTAQVPENESPRYRNSGQNLIKATVREIVTASTTPTPTPSMPEPGMADITPTTMRLPLWVVQDWKNAATMSKVGEGMSEMPNLTHAQHRQRFVREILRAPGRTAAEKELRVEAAWFKFCNANPKPYGTDQIFPVLKFFAMLPDYLADLRELKQLIENRRGGTAYLEYPAHTTRELVKAYNSWYDRMLEAHNEELDPEPDPGTSPR